MLCTILGVSSRWPLDATLPIAARGEPRGRSVQRPARRGTFHQACHKLARPRWLARGSHADRRYLAASTGREPELALHLRMALRQGWSEEELTEALLHLSGYVGVPIIRESMMAASKVFAEFRAEQAAQKPAST